MPFKKHIPTLADRRQEKKDLEAQLKREQKRVAETKAALQHTKKLIAQKKR